VEKINEPENYNFQETVYLIALELNNMNIGLSHQLTAEERSEVLFRILSGVGIATTILATAIWAILSPSPLIVFVVIPAVFFVYAYTKGFDVMNG